MRLHQIEIKNMTSLKGHHIIDFDQLLAQDDLFAVTGATGSGKSTILACIAMALFGKHYKSNLNSSDFVSHGSFEGSVTLYFSVHNHRYMAYWSCQVLKKNGEILKVPKILRYLEKDGEIVEDRIEDILSLDFEQFNKVVILNQGEFAQFLTSSFTARKEILEKLAGPKNLAFITKSLRKKLANVEQENKVIESNIDVFEEINSRSTKELQIELKEFLVIRDKAFQQNHLWKEFNNRTTEYFKIIDQNSTLTNRLNTYQEKLGSHTKVFNITKKELNKKNIDFETFQKEKREQSALLNLSIKSYRLLFENTRKCTEINGYIKEVQENIKLKESSIEELQKEKIVITEKIETINLSLDGVPKTEIEELKVLNHQQNTLEIQILDSDKNITHMKSELREIEKNAEVIKLSEAKGQKELKLIKKEEESFISTNQLNTLRDSLGEIKQSIQKNKIEANLLNKELLLFQEKLDNLSNIFNNSKIEFQNKELKYLLEKEKFQNQKLSQAIRLIQEKNETESNCLVCHAELFEPKESLGKNLENIIEQESIDILYQQLNLEREKQAKVSLEMTNLNEKVFEKKKSIENLSNYIEENQTFEVLGVDYPLDKAIDLIQELRKKRDYFEIQKSKLSTLHEENEKLIIRMRQEFSQKNTIINQANENKTKLSSQLEIRQKKQYQMAPQFKELSFEKKQKQLEQWSVWVKEYTFLEQEKKRFSDIIEEAKNQSSLHKKTLLQRTHEFELIKKKKLLIKSEIRENNYPENAEELLKDIDLKETLIADQLNNIREKAKEEEVLLNTKHTQVDGLKDQLKDLDNLYIFNLAKLSKIIETIEVENVFSKDYIVVIDKIKQSLNDSENKNLELLASLKDKFHFFSVQIEENYQQKQGKYIEMQTLYKESQEREKKKKEILKKKKEIQGRLKRYQSLYQLIGKDQFRDYVLNLIEDHLLWLANQELESLADGRYRLINEKAGKKNEYFVLDRWSGDSLRKVSTLSGGETFLIGLGLALGLAEMSRGQAEIDCFFVDEGFGTLDSESIEEVLSCLMSLRSRGKQIGIISHVKALTDQIPVNLHIKKGQTGQGQVYQDQGLYH
jgi:DNA repair protein SbcC/Rad50